MRDRLQIRMLVFIMSLRHCMHALRIGLLVVICMERIRNYSQQAILSNASGPDSGFCQELKELAMEFNWLRNPSCQRCL